MNNFLSQQSGRSEIEVMNFKINKTDSVIISSGESGMMGQFALWADLNKKGLIHLGRFTSIDSAKILAMEFIQSNGDTL